METEKIKKENCLAFKGTMWHMKGANEREPSFSNFLIFYELCQRISIL
jgi:hypothetical protein